MTEVHDQEKKNWNEEVTAMYAFSQIPTNQPLLELTHL